MSGIKAPEYKPCERCGRGIRMGGHRAKARILVCRDCYDADREYLRLRAAAQRTTTEGAAA